MQSTFMYCRYQKIVIPYGPTGKMVNPPDFRQILLITVWDAKSLLWTYHTQTTFNILKDEEKITFLLERLKQLGEMIMMMEPLDLHHPRTVNLTWTYFQ